MDRVCGHLHAAQASVNVDLVGSNGGNITTQGREGLHSEQKHGPNKGGAESQALELQLRRKLPNDWTFLLDLADSQWVAFDGRSRGYLAVLC